MKKLQLEITQVSNKDKSIITQSAIKVRVNGKFVENKITIIASEALEKNASVNYTVFKKINDELAINVTFKNGKNKTFYSGIKISDNYINPNMKIEDIKSLISSIKEFIVSVEEEIIEAHKYTNNYIIEF